jgi:alkylhydroperoxidase family enzyme
VTWVRDLPDAATDWDAVAQVLPDAAAAVAELHRTVWTLADPVLLELARLRMATLLDFQPGLRLRSGQARAAGLNEDKIAVLSSWPTSPLFSARERACVALAEQFLIDANGVTDQLVADVLEYLSPEETYGFVNAVSAFETLQRGSLTLGLDPSPEAGWLEAAEPAPPPGATGASD